MNTIQLPEYIIFNNGYRILTTNYVQELENEDLHLTADDHSITITRRSNGEVAILAYTTPSYSMNIDDDLEISQDTEKELIKLNTKL